MAESDYQKLMRYEAQILAQREDIGYEEAVSRILRQRAEKQRTHALGQRQLQRVRFKKKKGKMRGKDHAPQFVYGMVGLPLKGGAPGLGKRK